MVRSRAELVRRAVRRAVLAVSVLEDLDLQPCKGGVLVRVGGRSGLASWADLHAAFTREGLADTARLIEFESCPAQGHGARARLSEYLQLTAMLGDATGRERALAGLRLVALPADHELHPGPRWVRGAILGGVLELGSGVVDVLPGRADAVPLPAPIAAQLSLGGSSRWEVVVAHAEQMGRLVAKRLRRDTNRPDEHGAAYRIEPGVGALPSGVLRPMGGVDALSLLATAAVRQQLAGSDRSGMRAVAVPMRSRGWYDLARTDPSFVGAAWAATDVDQRGVPTALLVTEDEVSAGRPRVDLRTSGDHLSATPIDLRAAARKTGAKDSTRSAADGQLGAAHGGTDVRKNSSEWSGR